MVDKLIQTSKLVTILTWIKFFHVETFDCEVLNESSEVPSKYEYYGGGPALVFSSDEFTICIYQLT